MAMQGDESEKKQEPLNAAEPEEAEEALIREVGELWTSQVNHAIAARRTKDELRELRNRLAARLYELKSLLAQVGRAGRWSSYLREHEIPRASADRYVRRHETTLRPKEENRLSESILDTPEEAAHKLFEKLLPQLRRVLTSQRSAFTFAGDLILRLPGLDGDFLENGALVYRGSDEPSQMPAVESSQLEALCAVA